MNTNNTEQIIHVHTKHKQRRLNGDNNKVRRKKRCENTPSMIDIEEKLNGDKMTQNNNNNNNNKNSNVKVFPIGDTNKKYKKKKKKKSEELGNNEYSDSDENESKYGHLG
eukprot:222444_1